MPGRPQGGLLVLDAGRATSLAVLSSFCCATSNGLPGLSISWLSRPKTEQNLSAVAGCSCAKLIHACNCRALGCGCVQHAELC